VCVLLFCFGCCGFKEIPVLFFFFVVLLLRFAATLVYGTISHVLDSLRGGASYLIC